LSGLMESILLPALKYITLSLETMILNLIDLYNCKYIQYTRGNDQVVKKSDNVICLD
jgi:hypothetical protein